MIKVKEREIMELLQFMANLILNNEYITQKKFEKFNRFKTFVKLEKYHFIRSKNNKANLKVLGKDRICMKIKRSKYSYYKLIVKVKNLNQYDIVLFKSFLEYLEKSITFEAI